MLSPYNLDRHDNCLVCPWREEQERFCSMSEEALTTLNAMKFTSFYPKGAVLFVEGEQPRGVFIICSGKAKLTTTSGEGRTLILKLADPGEILGASATILGKPYEVSAETTEPSQLNFIRREDFMRLLTLHPEVCLRTAQQLSLKYSVAQREVRTLGLAHRTEERLSRLLLDWCQRAEKTPKGFRLKVLLTHEEIGQMIGTTRETVSRLMSGLKKKQIVEVKGSTVLVLRRDALEEMVNI